MNTTDILTLVHRVFDASGTAPSTAEIVQAAAPIRAAIVEKALDDAVLEGLLMRKRIDGVLRLLPAQAPALPPLQTQAQPAKSQPTPAAPLVAPGLPAFTVTLQPAIERAMPPGQGKWDALFAALMAAEKPAGGIVPTVELPLELAKALSAAGRTWAKKRRMEKCPFSFSKRGGKCVVQRVA